MGFEASLSDEARAGLHACRWPGNIRQLRNVLRRALIAAAGTRIEPVHLPPEALTDHSHASIPAPGTTRPAPVPALADAYRQVDRELIPAALAAAGGNREAAARLLRIDVKTLKAKLAPLERS